MMMIDDDLGSGDGSVGKVDCEEESSDTQNLHKRWADVIVHRNISIGGAELGDTQGQLES